MLLRTSRGGSSLIWVRAVTPVQTPACSSIHAQQCPGHVHPLSCKHAWIQARLRTLQICWGVWRERWINQVWGDFLRSSPKSWSKQAQQRIQKRLLRALSSQMFKTSWVRDVIALYPGRTFSPSVLTFLFTFNLCPFLPCHTPVQRAWVCLAMPTVFSRTLLLGAL